MQKVVLAFFFIVTCFSATAQNGYILTDTSYRSAIIEDFQASAGNDQGITVIAGKEKLKYKAADLAGFGFPDGPHFRSKEIASENRSETVFLELLVSGRLSLYKRRNPQGKSYYLEAPDKQLLHLMKTDFTSQLSDCLDSCYTVGQNLNRVRFTDESLTRFVAMYNDCKSDFFPAPFFGLKIGHYNLQYSVKNNSDFLLLDLPIGFPELEFRDAGTFVAGLFGEFPIFGSNAAFIVGLNYFRYRVETPIFSNRMQITGQQLELPVTIRYTIPKTKIHPYFEAGYVTSINLQSDVQTDIEVPELRVSKFQMGGQIGFSLAAGIRTRINHQFWYFLEARFDGHIGYENSQILNRRIQNVFFAGIQF